jgi:uncharacterized membrane protein
MLRYKKEMYFIPEISGVLITFLVVFLVLDNIGFWKIIQVAFIVNIPIQVISYMFKPIIKKDSDIKD